MDRLEERYLVARLIAKEIAGSLQEDEQQQLEEWKAASARNRREHERVARRLKQEIGAREEVDAEREWRDFKRKTRARRLTRGWRRAAAAAVLAGAMATGMYYYFSREEGSRLAGMPGEEIAKRHVATLVLGNGQQVEISDSSSGVLFAAGGGRVVARDNRLLYEGEESLPAESHAVIVPRGGEYELMLSDGTRVWLNSGSRITFPVHFDGATRTVEMQGEACFEVAAREGQPFMVRTGEVTLRVLGTLFNVEAYPGEPVIATLVNGSLQLSAGTREQLLRPGQQASVSDGEVRVAEVRAEEAVEWTRGFFTFTEAPLETIMRRLARWYDVEVAYNDPLAAGARFTVEIKRYDNIASVLSKIEKTGRVRFSIEGNRVLVEE
ncbi:MAG: FecR family protein [Odoribacteraceae bacterium]|jgi:ferric-dicitrate binding protein FerR (iron transport regulator)|nr:FecR family protein [Odoribacteraceae bacterium]